MANYGLTMKELDAAGCFEPPPPPPPPALFYRNADGLALAWLRRAVKRGSRRSFFEQYGELESRKSGCRVLHFLGLGGYRLSEARCKVGLFGI